MDEKEFQRTIAGSNKPFLIDFWAAWCKPCMIAKPVLEKLAEEYAGEVAFVPINADDSPEVLAHFRVLGIPTVIALRNGEEVGRVAGAQSEENYRRLFAALADGKDMKLPFVQFDRMLRLGAGVLFVIVGITTHSWIMAGVGGMIAFMGVYDRCPILHVITGMFKRS